MAEKYKRITKYFQGELKTAVEGILNNFPEIEEIRIREDKPITVDVAGKRFFVDKKGRMAFSDKECFVPQKDSVEEVFRCMCGYSEYAYSSEISAGFIYIPEGMRIGISGEAILKDFAFCGFKRVTGLNIRIPRQVMGAADSVIGKIIGGGNITNTIITSPPGYGKTTLLRDAIRQVSFLMNNVVVIDERGELSGEGYELGPCTDVLFEVPKCIGMEMAIRTLRPEVLAMDEINAAQDIEEIKRCYQFGTAIICTMHLDSSKLLPESLKEIFPLHLRIDKERRCILS